VAQRCGMAKSTVSLALRGDPRVMASTAQRIRALAAKMGYDPTPHYMARRLALLKHGVRLVNRVVGLLFPPAVYAAPFYARLLQGLVEDLTANDFNLIAGCFADDIKRTSIYHLLARGDVDALAFYQEAEILDPLVAQARAIAGFGDRPIMSLLFPNPRASAVVANETEAMRQAVRHLLALGHRHFLLVSVDLGSADRILAMPRWRGVILALGDAGLPANHWHLLPLAGRWMDPLRAPHYLNIADSPSSSAATDEWSSRLVSYLRQRPEITAILTQNDAAALNIWHLLHQTGWRIPDDYSLVGFDDTDPMFDASGRNLLATIRMPLVEVGREASRILRQRILGEIKEDRTVCLPAQFIPRASVAPPSRHAS